MTKLANEIHLPRELYAARDAHQDRPEIATYCRTCGAGEMYHCRAQSGNIRAIPHAQRVTDWRSGWRRPNPD